MKKNKVKRQARTIVIRWLETKHSVSCRWMNNRLAMENVASHFGQDVQSIILAASLVQPGFASAPLKSRAKSKLHPKGDDKIRSFYKSADWRRARYDALAANDGRCELCGASKHDGAVLNVDHIKPLRLHWHRRLDRSNLQILCGACNHGKGNRDDTDWREPSLRVLMGEGMK